MGADAPVKGMDHKLARWVVLALVSGPGRGCSVRRGPHVGADESRLQVRASSSLLAHAAQFACIVQLSQRGNAFVAKLRDLQSRGPCGCLEALGGR